MKPKKIKKKRAAYIYKCKNIFIDPRTGLASEFNPRRKGDGMFARASL